MHKHICIFVYIAFIYVTYFILLTICCGVFCSMVCQIWSSSSTVSNLFCSYYVLASSTCMDCIYVQFVIIVKSCASRVIYFSFA